MLTPKVSKAGCEKTTNLAFLASDFHELKYLIPTWVKNRVYSKPISVPTIVLGDKTDKNVYTF